VITHGTVPEYIHSLIGVCEEKRGKRREKAAQRQDFRPGQVYLLELPVVLATALIVEEAPLLTGIVPDAHLSTCAREPR
jgi:hypothetical protein